MRTVVGVFPSRVEAELVAHDLNAIGIPFDEVSIAEGKVSKDHDKEWSRRNIAAAAGSGFGWFLAGLIPQVAERTRAGAAEFGASIGGAAGILGGVAFAAVQTATVGAPNHMLMTALTGMCIGGTAGGFAAALYNMGVSHERGALCREAEFDHGVVVAAHVTEARQPEALKVLSAHGARNTRAEADAWMASGWTGAHPEEALYPSDSSFRAHPI